MAFCEWSVFFFQAEDGIRDGHVTGVQTCALPILFRNGEPFEQGRMELEQIIGRLDHRAADRVTESMAAMEPFDLLVVGGRSEERRVGKECRWERRAEEEDREQEEEMEEGGGRESG